MKDNLIEKITNKNDQVGNRKKIENIVFLIIILIITLILINTIWKGKEEKFEEKESTNKILAIEEDENSDTMEASLKQILSTIKGVGRVEVYISYLEGTSIVPIYNETITTSDSEEGDSSGGIRNVIETQTQKEVVFSEYSGEKKPVTQKTLTPIVKGAIITAEGAEDAIVKTNIINAVEAVTGLTIEKVQVFEMNS